MISDKFDDVTVGSFSPSEAERIYCAFQTISHYKAESEVANNRSLFYHPKHIYSTEAFNQKIFVLEEMIDYLIFYFRGLLQWVNGTSYITARINNPGQIFSMYHKAGKVFAHGELVRDADDGWVRQVTFTTFDDEIDALKKGMCVTNNCFALMPKRRKR